MPHRAMSATPETLLFLAWAARAGLRETVIDTQRGDSDSMPFSHTSWTVKLMKGASYANA